MFSNFSIGIESTPPPPQYQEYQEIDLKAPQVGEPRPPSEHPAPRPSTAEVPLHHEAGWTEESNNQDNLM